VCAATSFRYGPRRILMRRSLGRGACPRCEQRPDRLTAWRTNGQSATRAKRSFSCRVCRTPKRGPIFRADWLIIGLPLIRPAPEPPPRVCRRERIRDEFINHLMPALWRKSPPATPADLITALSDGMDQIQGGWTGWVSRMDEIGQPGRSSMGRITSCRSRARPRRARSGERAGGDQPVGRAISFLKALPADNARDKAIHCFVSRIAQQSPELAAEWVTKISDEKQRGYALAECGLCMAAE